MRHRIPTNAIFAMLLLIAVLFSTRLEMQAAPAEDSREVSKLLEDIQSQASDLQRDSDTLESFTRSNVSWESHAEELDRIKERINTIGETIKNLNSLRGSASPWQREAIDRILPLADRLAANTKAAINHLNKSPLRLQDPEYQQYLKSNAEVATNLAGLVREFVEYGKTNSTLEVLERRLEVSR
jgi:hypothetical protein